MENKKKHTDEECIAKWQSIIRLFNKTVENCSAPEKVSDQLNMIREMAKTSNELTDRQVGATLARCDNYTNGTYGNTKTKENIKYQTT